MAQRLQNLDGGATKPLYADLLRRGRRVGLIRLRSLSALGIFVLPMMLLALALRRCAVVGRRSAVRVGSVRRRCGWRSFGSALGRA